MKTKQNFDFSSERCIKKDKKSVWLQAKREAQFRWSLPLKQFEAPQALPRPAHI
ncbi:MAG: hypothetical protein QM523_05715 [Candidatus Pacebacteria bacterium]|nr:hypothetical protein [Candidatus Paceibacterota bacterium]